MVIISIEIHTKREPNWDVLKVFDFASYIWVVIAYGFILALERKKKERKIIAKPEESDHLPITCKRVNK